jgi:hypothetical protein
MRNGFWSGTLCVTACLVLAIPLLLFPDTGTAGEVTSGVDLKFWGRAIFNTHYDTDLLTQDFMAYIDPEVAEDTDEFNFNPRDTRLGFAASQASEDWTYRAVFEIDFYGDNASNNLLPRLRLGYAEAKNSTGLTIRGGLDWIPIAQQNPGTVDFGILSWAGNLWWRVPQLTVRYKNERVEYLVSAMKHRVSDSQEQQETMPWMIGRVAVSDLLGEGSLVAVGGAFRSVTVDSMDYSPYLAALEVKVPFGDSGVALTGEAYLGKGFGREFIHYGFDYNPVHPDGATEIESKGGFASLLVPASDKVDLNFGYGFDDPKDEDLEDAPPGIGPYLKNTAFFGNFKYKVTKNFGWGLEVCSFATDVGADDDLTGQRFTTSWWFTF